jgi:diguanylate cyclase (GGDEF)-like protein
MQILLRIDLNIFCLAICLVMLAASLRMADRRMVHNRLFSAIILSTSVLIALECLSWAVDGQPGAWARTANYAIEMAGFVLASVPPLLWSMYASYQMFHDIKRLKRMLIVLAVPIAVNAALTLSSPYTGLMFTISSGNIYHRGPGFWIMAGVCYLTIVYTALCSLINRRRISNRLFVPLLMFAIPPVVFSALQCLFYGLTLTWTGITLSIFIVHASLQNQQFSLDHLTRVFERRPLDNYLIDRMRTAHRGRLFALIMLDIDDFKSINDRFGHIAGDEALKDAAAILKSCVRSGDFLARYAGDEFVIVLDTDNLSVPEQMVKRIRESTAAFNSGSHKPYSISFSAGFAVYDRDLSLDGFISQVDALMYSDKFSRKPYQAAENDTSHASGCVSA